MLPEMPWKEEPVVQRGWERLIQEIESRTGLRGDGDTLEEKMAFLDSKVESRGFSAFGSHVELTLAFLLATGRLCLVQLHEVIEEQPDAASFFGDIESASIEMLALCAQTAFDPLMRPAVAEFARFGYDPNQATSQNDHLLHLAAESGRLEMARALLAIGAHPNLRDPRGCTALHRVLSSDLPQLAMREMAQALVDCGASLEAVSEQGVSPRQLLVSLGWNRMAASPPKSLPASGSRRLS